MLDIYTRMTNMLTYSDIPCASRVRFNQACSLNDNALLSTLSFAATPLPCMFMSVCELEIGGYAEVFMFFFVYDLIL